MTDNPYNEPSGAEKLKRNKGEAERIIFEIGGC
jgi:hypothetical protein